MPQPDSRDFPQPVAQPSGRSVAPGGQHHMRRLTRLTMGLTLAAALTLGTGGTALADHTGDAASCAGIGISDHAAWRKTGDVPWQGETGELKVAQDILKGAGIPLGAFMREFAQVHAEVHRPGCEDAAGEIFGQLLAP